MYVWMCLTSEDGVCTSGVGEHEHEVVNREAVDLTWRGALQTSPVVPKANKTS